MIKFNSIKANLKLKWNFIECPGGIRSPQEKDFKSEAFI